MIAQPQKTKVLVIDDELGPRESIRMLLKPDYEVLCAESVDDGLKLLRDRQPDLVLLDIRMPKRDGITGLRQIRESDSAVSVVILTGHGTLETARQALRLGASDYVSKPFDTKEMQNIVSRFTQRSALERKRQRMLQELQEVNSQLVHDLADREFMASLGQSSAEFAHDLRNPLMIVSGYVSLLSQQLEKARDAAGGEYAQAAEYLDVIEHNVERCCELAHMWQRLGHAELNERKPTPAGEVLNTLAAATEPLGSAKRVAITYDLSAGTAVVEGNAAQLIRALYNIVANAVQAVESGAGGVRVSAASDDGHLAVAVEDNGCGMSEETLARIFEPYFTTRRSGQGTGLGMSIAKRIVDEHGGAITVRSAVGQGTTVTVRIPLLGRARPEAAVTAGR